MPRTCLLALLLCVGACAPQAEPPPRTLRLLQIRPENPRGVYLDEELVLHFSAPLDPDSATLASVRVVDDSGRAARGRVLVEGATLRFEPAPVLARDLRDGGFVPGANYELRVLGFPAPDGLRAVDGAPLDSGAVLRFTTVVPGGGLGAFRPRPEERPRPLRFFPPATGDGRWTMGPHESVYLDCDLPLDPSSFADEAFELLDPAGKPVALRVRLLENERTAAVRPRPERARAAGDDDTWRREPRAALVELTPLSPLAPGRHALRLAPRRFLPRLDRCAALGPLGLPLVWPWPELREARPLDAGGRSVWDRGLSAVSILVVERGTEGPRNLVVEEFLDTRLRSPVPVEGVDGTAAWRGDGRVTVRFPAAAGSGEAGEIELRGTSIRADMQSVRLRVPAGAVANLDPRPGPVVLRAQGALRVDGTLRRSSGKCSGFEAQRPLQGLSAWIDELLRGPADAASNWTILVAGGDLVVDGTIDVDTPLLLVAGGMIRVRGEVRAGGPDQILRLGEGGGGGMVASVPEWLLVDEPLANPLRAPLIWAVRSGALPQRGEVREWLWASASGSVSNPRSAPRPGSSGSWRVRWLGTGAAAAQTPRADPRFVEPPGPLHMLIELTVQPGGAWDPPWVDRVEAAFEERG